MINYGYFTYIKFFKSSLFSPKFWWLVADISQSQNLLIGIVFLKLYKSAYDFFSKNRECKNKKIQAVLNDFSECIKKLYILQNCY